ncbi:MAG: MBL fold metallo-hydrolase [Desulfovibrio sp.]|nr:MBL fold metallo-hydrolase [Desulfovibrio sp.]
MKMTVLVDNNGTEELPGEWGLSIFIEHGGLRWLLDAGQSDLHLRNAASLGIDLALVDHAVLSHAHYDHADGLRYFLSVNSKANIIVAAGAGERCWKIKGGQWEYIGISKGLLAQVGTRLKRIACIEQIEKGVYILPHVTEGLEKKGLAEQMYVRDGEDARPDDFSHEQSLVFETPQGLVVFNSCSHAGADIVVREVMEALPDRPLHALVGGFHLYNKTEEYVRVFARRMEDTGVKSLCTGHCTGETAFEILREEMGSKAVQFRTGFAMEV